VVNKKGTYKIVIVFLIVLITYLLVSYILFQIENVDDHSNIHSFSDALWYSIVTLTTVGYGDKYPITGFGRFISLFFVIGSIGLLSYFISSISKYIEKMVEEKRLGYNGTDFENHVVIINFNTFAQQVLREVTNANRKVVVVTTSKKDVEIIYNNFKKKNVFVFYNDLADIKAFEKANIRKANTVFLNYEDDTENLVNLISIKEYYGDLKFVISLNNPSLKETFRSLGVTFTLSKNEASSKLVASYVFEPEVAKLTEGMMSSGIQEDDFGIMQFLVVKENLFINQSYLDVFYSLKKGYNVILVAISKFENGAYKLYKNPEREIKVELNDYLVVMSNQIAKDKIVELFKVDEGI
jgi:voltage-gated potassium channel